MSIAFDTRSSRQKQAFYGMKLGATMKSACYSSVAEKDFILENIWFNGPLLWPFSQCKYYYWSVAWMSVKHREDVTIKWNYILWTPLTNIMLWLVTDTNPYIRLLRKLHRHFCSIELQPL